MEELDEPADSADDLTLRVWDGDQSVLGELLLAYGPAIEVAIGRKYPSVAHYAEDIVAEAYKLLWKYRENYDGTRSLRAYLYRIAANVAADLATGHFNWQKSRNLEKRLDEEWLSQIEHPLNTTDETLDAIESSNRPICKALREAMDVLNPVERAVLEASACANGEAVNAGQLGIELGKQHGDGVPIPAGTVRQHKLRGKNKLVAEMRKRGYELKDLGVST